MSANDIINWTIPFIKPLAPIFSVVIGLSQGFKIINGVQKIFNLRGF